MSGKLSTTNWAKLTELHPQVVNLVEKYGVMPKKCFPETYSSENSLRMNRLLKSKVSDCSI